MPLVKGSATLRERLGFLRLVDTQLNPIAIASLWRTRALILIHLNSFGSLSGQLQVQSILDAIPDFDASGVALAAIGSGEAQAAEAFGSRFTRRFPLLLDPQLRSYEVVGEGHRKSAKRSSPSALMMEVKTLRSATKEVSGVRAQLVLGATHVFRAGGELALAWLNELNSGTCPTEEVLKALG